MIKAVLAALALAISGHAVAQSYPTKPIRVIVPFAPGSATDLLGRVVAQGLSEKLGQPVIVEPKPGAGTSLGAQAVEKSPADGYTILLGTNATFSLNSILYQKLPYDPNSFSYIAATGAMPSYLLVSSTSKYKTFADFVKAAKEKPGSVTYASSGVGSTGDMAGKLLAHAAGVELLHVPFKDGPMALTATMSGDVEGIFYTSIASMGLINSGKIRPLAVTTEKRTVELPRVPTIAESGYPNFNLSGWTVLAVSNKTPQAIVQKLTDAMKSLYANPSYQKKIEALGLVPQKMTGKELEDFIAKERASMQEVAKSANIKPE
ncbi:Tripartite-type tricarboxylate transporter, receptor component TctC [Polaromonas sp. OV174]|uniref:Bug family tripartite tricarboxylate transporter substrate binding protein n=1 Tax=Polaromonas sp. OV174 TaxID=1855300 RepID=UPI0008E4BBC2|nr:tripartite tricarboxylate transporter substrate binding protein [Polaromonas sp. OV174]SFC63495.1 Tripartite-type tricarboxylate transporter, receptor component TctC [Polaromonas sp. OV174]